MDQALSAIDIRRTAGHAGIMQIADLPVVKEIVPDGKTQGQAILSWKWDVDPRAGTSRNISAAVAHAQDAGLEHLFVDKVSIDQSLKGRDLIEAVSTFSHLFQSVRTIAAYDTPSPPEDMRHFLRTVRRPWIAKELLTMRPGRQTIHYAGHIKDQGIAESFGFRHMVDRVWTTSFANSILYVLTGFCDMYDVAELPLIMPEYDQLLFAASRTMIREDVLLTAAIVSQIPLGDRVNGDINIRDVKFRQYRFARAESSVGFWENWEVLLNGVAVARWSEKDYTYDEMPRRKLTPTEDALKTFANSFQVNAPKDEQEAPIRLGADAMKERIQAIELYDLCGRFGRDG